MEFQDWSVLRHTSDDDDGYGGPNDDDVSSGDSNHNRYHPGLDAGDVARHVGRRRCGSPAPGTTHHRGLTFRSHRTVLIGSFACPIIEPRGRQAAVQYVGARAIVGTENQAVVGPEIQAKSCQVEEWKADISLGLP